jgi:UTP--glucose-1-phosphate uridylyltransferase
VQRVASGEQSEISEADIESVENLDDAETLEDFRAAGTAAIKQAVLLKLNGGLGTSMGLNKAKNYYGNK